MKLKASCLALAFVALVVPVSAEERFSHRGVQVGETQISRFYRAQWVAAYGRAQARHAVLSNASSSDRTAALPIDGIDPATATLVAKVQSIAARVKGEAQRSAGGSPLVASRLRVRCVSKSIVVTRETAQPFVPAMVWSASAPGPVVERVVVETCSVRLSQVRRTIQDADRLRPYSVTLPVPDFGSASK